MPKETIHDTAGTFDVRVGWDAEAGHVQVGVEQSAGFSLLTVLYGSSRDDLARLAMDIWAAVGAPPLEDDHDAAELGRRILDAVEARQPTPDGPSYTGVWSTLNRASINRLIRVLRRARDQAYGRDE